MNDAVNENIEKLRKYRLFAAKIERLNEMGLMFPKERKHFLEKAQKCRQSMKNIERAIAKVDDGLLSEILFQKYVLGRNFDAVSLAVNYSKRQTERLHLAALKKLKI